MQQRRLGTTNIDVSVIGLGTVKFGRNQGVKYPTDFALPSDKEITALLNLASELGINLLDTAPAYGNSEERLGQALRGERHKWVLSTKVGEEFINGESRFDFSAKYVRQSVERSLQRLQTDYLDIVLVHSNGDDENIIQVEKIFSELALLKQAGQIRAFGMSTKTISGGKLTIDLADVAMVSFSPTYTDEREIIAYAKQQHKGILIKKALVSGHLPVSVVETMRFIFSEPGVTSIIVGTLNPSHLQQNVKAAIACF